MRHVTREIRVGQRRCRHCPVLEPRSELLSVALIAGREVGDSQALGNKLEGVYQHVFQRSSPAQLDTEQSPDLRRHPSPLLGEVIGWVCEREYEPFESKLVAQEIVTTLDVCGGLIVMVPPQLLSQLGVIGIEEVSRGAVRLFPPPEVFLDRSIIVTRADRSFHGTESRVVQVQMTKKPRHVDAVPA